MFSKPFTSTIAPELIPGILCRVPIHAEEHLVQGWDAIRAALDASTVDDRANVDANIAFAKRRLDHAISVVQRAKFMKREALKVECIELARAIDDAVRFF